MATVTEPTTTLTIRVPQGMRDQLDDLARATGRQRSYLANEALRKYLEIESWQIAQIQEGIRAADSGDFATPEQVEAVRDKYQAHRAEPTN
jgi:RHH-type transcriptional regulator, rel operon repressor / antitoxin RelB